VRWTVSHVSSDAARYIAARAETAGDRSAIAGDERRLAHAEAAEAAASVRDDKATATWIGIALSIVALLLAAGLAFAQSRSVTRGD
jgi:hypothetical protein